MSNSPPPSWTLALDTIPLQTVPTVDGTLGQTGTRAPPSTIPAESAVTPAAMELALEELRTTITEAEQYQKQEQHHPEHLRSHIAALQEDIEMLAAFETADDALRTVVTQTIFTARRLKRHLERAAIDATDKQGKKNPTLKEGPIEEKSGLKLTPLKIPEFNGNTAQFQVFRNFFEENILNNAALTDTAKWLRLKESLVGPAAELIAELPQTPHTLKVAWKLLTDVYGGDEKPIVELYDRLQRLSPASNQTAALRLTHSKLEGILLSLEHLGHDIDKNSFLRWVVLSKYPPEMMYQVPQKRDTPLRELRTAIAEVIAIRENADYQRAETVAVETRKRLPRPLVPIPRTAVASATTSDGAPAPRMAFRPRNCVFCTADHWNDSCTVYPTLAERKARIAGKCHKCLQPTHEPARCNNVKRCFHCDSYEHNRALCPVKFEATSEKSIATLALREEEPQQVGCFLTFLAQAQVDTAGKSHTVRIVVDTAAGATLIRREIAQVLDVEGATNRKITYTGLSGSYMTEGYQSHTPVQILANNKPVLTIQPAIVEAIVQELPTIDVEQFKRENPAFADKSIPPTGHGQPVDILLGSDAMVDLLIPEKILHVNANTLLVPTRVGWLILGRRREPNLQVCHTTMLHLAKNPLKLMSDLDVVGLTDLHDSEIEEEQAAIRYFYETVQFVDGRYSISWPWRSIPPRLDTNYGLALGRLKSLYKRLQSMPYLLKEYADIIAEQEKNGIIEKVTSQTKVTSYIHYVPHHPILQPEKSTKIRPVYDGAATSGPKKLSLNDNILKGSKWLNDLVETLIRFRRHKIALTADIAKAFHQIAINEADRDVVRFIWLKDATKPPIDENLQIYRFTRVAFGVIASPFILHAVIQYHASKQNKNDLLPVILRDLYADNLVTTIDESVQPNELYNFAKSFFGSMNMNLTKWVSNDQQFQRTIPEEDRLPGATQMVLGVRWSTIDDTMALKIPKIQPQSQPTRRTVAKEMASFFDPLGWVAPVILLAKIFFRKVWSKTEKWDENLDKEDNIEWLQIFAKLQEIESLTLPRRFTEFPTKNVQLHTFVDASAQAYAVVTYVRVTQDNQTRTAIVAARSRLAPKKQLSIPKLELIAFVLGCKFTKFVANALEIETSTNAYIWSDSKCVLAWMKQKRLLPVAIHKHVQEATACGLKEFNYVPSQLNYADVATRGASFSELAAMNWWQGPSWLANVDDWPLQKELEQPEIQNSILAFQTELRTRETILKENETTGIATLRIQSFSTLTKLLKATALCFEATRRLLKNPKQLEIQNDTGLNEARRKWLIWDQNREYRLKGEPEAGKVLQFRNINVFRDVDGLLRCQTRLLNTFRGTETSNPVLLVKNSTLTKLLILHIHKNAFHAGTSYTLANLRKEFWLPHGRRHVYKIIFNECYACRRNLAQPYPTPPPIPLPEFRVLRTQKPFQVIGLDIFGPLLVRLHPGRNQPKQKLWGIIFTCAVVRAIHIETLDDMTTEEITFAIRRFVARRGVPYKIISDNAPQFHELDACFENLWKTVSKNPQVSHYLAEKRIEWKFITDTSPWMGGFYERMIRIIKNSLEKTYQDRILLKRQLQTTLIEIEAIVNSRPISYVDREMETPIVTPNDFLTSTFVSVPIESNIQQQDGHIAKLWKSSQQYLDQFWHHWAEQYLLMLRDRHDQLRATTKTAQNQPQKGDIVIMIDLTKKRSQWQTAVVERKIHSQDGVVRSLQIRLPNRIRLIRPVVALAPLRLTIDLPQITDDQLNKKRDAIVIWSPEGAAQECINNSQSNLNADGENNQGEEGGEEQQRRYRESEAGSGGSVAVPNRSNGSENELGSAAAEPAPCGTSIAAANSSLLGSVVKSHELHESATRERSERQLENGGS